MSRNHHAKGSFTSTTVQIDIRPFETGEAGEFLQRITNNDEPEDHARLVSHRLGGLPLAIVQMAGMKDLQFLSFEEFLGIYDEPLEEAEIHETELQPLRQTARGNISSIWAIEKLSAEARAILEVLAFLDPDRVQDGILTRHGTLIHTMPHFPQKKGAFYRARTELIRSSLVKRNDETGEFWVHRAVQDAVRGKMQHGQRLTVFLNVVRLLCEEWPTTSIGSHDVELWDRCEGLSPHVIALQSAFLKYFRRADGADILAFAAILNRAAW